MNIAFHTLHVPGADPERDAIVQEQIRQIDPCVHIDPDRKGVMWNWLSALRCSIRNDVDADWVVILQDDALPLEGWRDHLGPALANSPEDVLGLTHFGGYGGAALKKGAAYAVGRYLLWGGAVAIRSSILRDVTSMALRFNMATGYQHDDGMLALYQNFHGHQTAITARAIFGQPVKASLLGHNTAVRQPSHTIENSDGPEYHPQSIATVSRGNRVKFEERLANVRRVMA